MVLSSTSRLASEEDARLSGTLNRYLHWYELMTYKDQGMQLYDFGGVGDGSGPIARFKLSFGGFRTQDYRYVFARALGRIAYKFYKSLLQCRINLRGSSPLNRGEVRL
jgi:lipid II:glycine glycyltransferase (peptidoglycan interpeptide bridge formation enzyme)